MDRHYRYPSFLLDGFVIDLFLKKIEKYIDKYIDKW